MLTIIRPAVVLFVLLSVLTGVIYPAIVTGFAGVVFHDKANGSVIKRDGLAIGSELIGQRFTDPKYFWSRPSAVDYDAAAASGSNLSTTNAELAVAIQERIKAHGQDGRAAVPVDLVTTSGSGLDPHISVAAARFQIGRVAQARRMSQEDVARSVEANTEQPTFGILGEARVNVLGLNLSLDGRAANGASK